MTRTSLAALASAALFALTACSSPKINEDMTDVEALAAEEAFVADTIAELGDFSGFEGRVIELRECLYGMNEDQVAEGAAKVRLTYSLPEALAEDPAAAEALAAEVEAVWKAQGYEVERELAGDGSLWAVKADGEEVLGWYYPGSRFEVSAGGCVLIADGDFVVPEALGGVTAENDDIENHSPRTGLED
ncbi:hypothetical protein [Glycomyces paridis]|uniref:DUF4853 domain-containing protein n=1 Tax=Glycomyces paridis TaxID=2126555 RepID=A0A4S8PDD4_9ACTN|nr:hypothetical protein [Glycomyces paridis]THV27565.1 hypothetical protein E9998_14225 [Glycomyces paridis]